MYTFTAYSSRKIRYKEGGKEDRRGNQQFLHVLVHHIYTVFGKMSNLYKRFQTIRSCRICLIFFGRVYMYNLTSSQVQDQRRSI